MCAGGSGDSRCDIEKEKRAGLSRIHLHPLREEENAPDTEVQSSVSGEKQKNVLRCKKAKTRANREMVVGYLL